MEAWAATWEAGANGSTLAMSKKFREVDEVLASPEIDAVDICLPTYLHFPVARQAMLAGKHVLVEKPMALTGGEADELVRLATETGKVLMSAQVLRFFPEYLALRESLAFIGTPRHALFRRRCAAPFWSRWLQEKAQSGGGVFDLLIHDIDMALWLFGTPERLSAVGREDLARGIDVLTGTLYYPSGLSVVITGGWHHPRSYPFSMEYTVVAENGTVEYNSAGRPPTIYRADGSEAPLELPAGDGYVGEITYFVDCVRRNGRPEMCSPESSARAVKLALLLDEARSRNGEIISCQI